MLTHCLSVLLLAATGCFAQDFDDWVVRKNCEKDRTRACRVGSKSGKDGKRKGVDLVFCHRDDFRTDNCDLKDAHFFVGMRYRGLIWVKCGPHRKNSFCKRKGWHLNKDAPGSDKSCCETANTRRLLEMAKVLVAPQGSPRHANLCRMSQHSSLSGRRLMSASSDPAGCHLITTTTTTVDEDDEDEDIDEDEEKARYILGVCLPHAKLKELRFQRNNEGAVLFTAKKPHNDVTAKNKFEDVYVKVWLHAEDGSKNEDSSGKMVHEVEAYARLMELKKKNEMEYWDIPIMYYNSLRNEPDKDDPGKKDPGDCPKKQNIGGYIVLEAIETIPRSDQGKWDWTALEADQIETAIEGLVNLATLILDDAKDKAPGEQLLPNDYRNNVIFNTDGYPYLIDWGDVRSKSYDWRGSFIRGLCDLFRGTDHAVTCMQEMREVEIINGHLQP
eukprot:TRINITY_DN78603_c0_g1_i1.p1 TRINITY_DN78603_c0_g1~~TRINITY_DN78603_c0_g1_i1.p1  ORF type:complete len:443 (-),score=46.62 TRINITY_DN78603_c0_g1_i1:116-1444(-)